MYIIGSVLGQFAIHIATLVYLSNYVSKIEPYVSSPLALLAWELFANCNADEPEKLISRVNSSRPC